MNKVPQAATEGSLTSHGDPLTKGKGSKKVKIGGYSAWRVIPIDQHTCTEGSTSSWWRIRYDRKSKSIHR